MTRTNQLGELQLAILQELWRSGELAVSDVHAALYPARQLAPTTIATMLKKMEARGLVTHRTEGRRFLYRPAVTEDKVTRSMVSDLTERLFEGNAADLVTYLIREHIDAGELDELEKLIAAAESKKENS